MVGAKQLCSDSREFGIARGNSGQHGSRWLILAPHFPEYSMRFGDAMSDYASVQVLVDRLQVERECPELATGEALSGIVDETDFRSPRDLLLIVRSIQRFQPSVVHMHEAVGLRRSAISLIVAILFFWRCRIVLTVHDPDPHSGTDARLAKRVWVAQAVVRWLAHVVLVHGESCKARYKRRRRQLLVAVNHGVLLGPPRLLHRQPTQAVRFVCVGRMEHYKGLDVLCDAIDLLCDDGRPSFDVRIGGRGPELDRLKGRLGRMGCVSIEDGFLSREALRSIIYGADVVLLPYLSATGSGVLASALGCGRGVIASAVGDIADVVRNGEEGLLVRPGSAEALAASIRAVCDDPRLAEKMSRAAVLSAEDRLSWSSIARCVAGSVLTADEAGGWSG